MQIAGYPLNGDLLVLIIAAIAVGFLLGRSSFRVRFWPRSRAGVQQHYIKGLNYLLNEQPDAAVETFIDALEVNSKTLETHLSLGNLLRKRGEVSGAIKVHQNILSHPHVPRYCFQQIQVELARDYIKAGLLDRAELLLQELVLTAVADIRVLALKYLIEIYRDEKEWARAIDTQKLLAESLGTQVSDEWRVAQAHFYCEMAEQAINQVDYTAGRQYLVMALAVDKMSARASLLYGELELQQGHQLAAIDVLRQIPQQDIGYVSQAISLLITCHRQLDSLADLRAYLQELQQLYDGASLVVALAELIAHDDGEDAAVEYLQARLAIRPSLAVLSCLLQYRAGQLSIGCLPPTVALIEQLQRAKPDYRCNRCGFSGHQLHWLCPTCKTWSSIRPIKGLEGE